MREITTADDLARVFSVSRETIDKLEIYESILRRWQRAVNLVAPSTLPSLWSRHFADSLQLAARIPPSAKTLVDIGTGGGFPGLVLATHFAVAGGPSVTLVESDQRKCAFLREAARAMEIPVEILSTRIENDANLQALTGVDVVTARALAPLSRLLAFVAPYASADTVCVFLKGREVGGEIDQARSHWSFDLAEYPSITAADARIIVVRGIASLQRTAGNELGPASTSRPAGRSEER